MAIVCADTEKNARAAAAVVVELEQLPELLHVKDAMKPGAVKVYDEIPDLAGIPNCFNVRPIIKERTKPLIDNAKYVVDDEDYSSRQPHLTLETDCGFGYFDEAGHHPPRASACTVTSS